MIIIKIKGIEQEELLAKIYEDIKYFNQFYHLVADEDGDITFRKKEWDDDSNGAWSWSEESNKAWMRPHFGDDGKCTSIGQKNNKMLTGVYAFYHSEFSRFLLTQFDMYIDEIVISGSVMEGDCIKNN